MTLIQLNRAIAIRAELVALDQRRQAFDTAYTNLYNIAPATFQRHKADVIADLKNQRDALTAEFQTL